MGLDVRKPVLGVSDKVMLKPTCSATESDLNIEISLVASLDLIHSKNQLTKALISLRRCPGWFNLFCSQTLRTGFLVSMPKLSNIKLKSINQRGMCIKGLLLPL